MWVQSGVTPDAREIEIESEIETAKARAREREIEANSVGLEVAECDCAVTNNQIWKGSVYRSGLSRVWNEKSKMGKRGFLHYLYQSGRVWRVPQTLA